MGELPTYKEKFARLVAEGSTYAEALRKSHPKAKKWKDNTVWINSSKLMADTKVQLRVEELQHETAKRNQATLDEVLNEMASWLRFNPKSIANDDGSIKDLAEMSDDEAKCIVSFDVQELWSGGGEDRRQVGVIKKIKVVDKRAVSDQFLKKFGAYVTNINVKTDNLDHIEDLLDGIDK
jgi:phage terminase small subunit